MENFIKNENTRNQMFLLIPGDDIPELKKDLNKREVLVKETSPYGIHYKMKCGWYIDWNHQTRRWEIQTLSAGKFIGRFTKKEEIKEIIE